jgi:hypothetical protein
MGAVAVVAVMVVAIVHAVDPTKAPVQPIALSVTGDASTKTVVTVTVNGGRPQKYTGVLPWTMNVSGSSRTVVVSAKSEDSSPTATVACEIDLPDTTTKEGDTVVPPPVTDTTTGPDAVVTCTAA